VSVASESCECVTNASGITIVSLNVNGGVERKLESESMLDYLKHFDIIFLSETWTNPLSKVDMNGYVCVSKHRRRRKRAKRDSGGLICYIKSNFKKGIIAMDWDFEDGLVMRLDKQCFGFNENVFLILPYVKPNTSSRSTIDTGIDAFDIITNKIAELTSLGNIIIMGDLNARTGKLNDCTFRVSENQMEGVDWERSITREDLVDSGMKEIRANEDNSVNEYGHRLVGMCK